MKKETDLGGVKAIAKTLLMTAVNQTPYSPMLVQHPFTSSGLVALPTDKTTDEKQESRRIYRHLRRRNSLCDGAGNRRQHFQLYYAEN